MYRRAEFFKIDYPLTLQDIKTKIGPVTKKPRRVPDKNALTKKITLDCSFDHKNIINGHYILGMEIEYQITLRKGVPYQKTRDVFAFLFFAKQKILVVLGRDEAIVEAVKEVSNVLYGDTKNIKPFRPVKFTKDSLVGIINKLKQDDDGSWCDEYNAHHTAIKYQGKKTKTNFSLGEGNCVLEDEEAQQEIDNATSISPKYRFTKCPQLNGESYPQPKTLTFNGRNGVVSLSIRQDFENWYRFVSNFLLQHLELSED